MPKPTFDNETLIKSIIARKQELGLTNAEIADKSNVPLSTVIKVMNGTSKSPGIDTLVPIASALGIDVGDLNASAKDADDNGNKENNNDLIKVVNKNQTSDKTAESDYTKIDATQYLIKSLEKQIVHRDRWICLLSAILFVLVGGLMFFLIYDVTHPHMGWVQYTAYFQEKINALKEIFHL